MESPSPRWTAYAAGYEFLCAAALLAVLSPVSSVLGNLLALPEGSAVVVLALPVPVFGAVVWWTVVERRGAYTYPAGALCGLVTALLTAGFWLLLFAVVWGASLVLTGGILVGFVVAVVTPVSLVAGIPIVYARRRSTDRVSAGSGTRSPEP